MSEARDPSDHGGRNDPEFRVGRGKPARRRIALFGVGIVLFVFAVLLVIWLLGRSAADAQGSVEDRGRSSAPGGPVTSDALALTARGAPVTWASGRCGAYRTAARPCRGER